MVKLQNYTIRHYKKSGGVVIKGNNERVYIPKYHLSALLKQLLTIVPPTPQ